MPDYTQTMRRSLDTARNKLKMPQTVELLKRAQSGPNKGGYAALYTVDGGWLIMYETEETNGQKSSFIRMIVTHRDELTNEIMSQLTAFRYRDLNYKKKEGRPTLSENPKYWEISFEATGEKA